MAIIKVPPFMILCHISDRSTCACHQLAQLAQSEVSVPLTFLSLFWSSHDLDGKEAKHVCDGAAVHCETQSHSIGNLWAMSRRLYVF